MFARSANGRRIVLKAAFSVRRANRYALARGEEALRLSLGCALRGAAGKQRKTLPARPRHHRRPGAAAEAARASPAALADNSAAAWIRHELARRDRRFHEFHAG